jgi:hypothetical protein
MDNISLVKDALAYYDTNNEKYNKIILDNKYFKIIKNKLDSEHNTIILYNENKKEIYKSRYEIIGIYDFYNSVWTWGWSIVDLRKNTTSIIRKVLQYGLELDPEDNFIKIELINSRFRVSNRTQLDIHLAIASYLSKKPVIYELVIDENKESQKIDDELLYPIEVINKSISYFLFLLDYE